MSWSASWIDRLGIQNSVYRSFYMDGEGTLFLLGERKKGRKTVIFLARKYFLICG